jgi:PadR family transcriptional regulator, regulatory protein AphA
MTVSNNSWQEQNFIPVRSNLSRVRRPTTTTHAILGLLALRPSWTATELADQISRNMRFFWPRASSRVYAESRAAVERGWALSSSEARTGRGAPSRTRYRISARGRRELRRWLATTPKGVTLESEALLRILMADEGSDEALRSAIQAIAADADLMFATARTIAEEYLTGKAPFQDDVHVRALVFAFLADFANMSADWARRAEEYVDRWSDLDDVGRSAAGVELVRARTKVMPAAPERQPQARQEW